MFELIDFLIVNPIINILFVIYNFVGDFGFAIILFTIVVKIITWPILKRQLNQSKIMRKMQPELAAIKKNCNGNRQLESLQMLDLYKRYNFKPFASFLTLLVQIPIFIALFTAIRVVVTPVSNASIETRAYPFVKQLDKIQDLSHKQQQHLLNPETSYAFEPRLFNFIDLNAKASELTNVSAYLILSFALAIAFSQYIIAKQSLPSVKKRSFRDILRSTKAGKEPDQTELNQLVSRQMSIMMPLMMFMFMINLPGAIVFYYLINNIITIIQQKIIFDQRSDELELVAEKAVLKELKNLKEAEIIQNKKTGTKITRISAKDRPRPKK